MPMTLEFKTVHTKTKKVDSIQIRMVAKSKNFRFRNKGKGNLKIELDQ